MITDNKIIFSTPKLKKLYKFYTIIIIISQVILLL